MIVQLKIAGLRDQPLQEGTFKEACKLCEDIANSGLDSAKKTEYLTKLTKVITSLEYNPQEIWDYQKCQDHCRLRN